MVVNPAALVSGDPVSCSRLGGALRRYAGRLADRCVELEALLAQSGTAADAGPDEAVGAGGLSERLSLVAATARDLDAAGALLQRYATELAEAQELARRVERSVAAAGLVLDAGRVGEPWGPARADVAHRRREAAPELQALADRCVAAAGRARGRFRRGAADAVAVLAARSGQLRGIPSVRRPG
ncbi:MAG TPA: hypothetical protein VFJ97_06160 [Dermatophilaceae bacterium]|nr:hypothetical protein [Dermatophilaceae bacterium]